jgi:hypothetical protein
MRSTEPIIAFCHFEKTAGTTLTELPRAHFGLRHADVLRHAIVRDGSEAPYFYVARVSGEAAIAFTGNRALGIRR